MTDWIAATSIAGTPVHALHNTPNYTHTNNQQAMKSRYLSSELDTQPHLYNHACTSLKIIYLCIKLYRIRHTRHISQYPITCISLCYMVLHTNTQTHITGQQTAVITVRTFAMDILSIVPINTTPFILLLTVSAMAADEQRSLTLQKLLKYSNFISPSNSLNRSSNDSY